MLPRDPLPLTNVAGKNDGDGMEVWTGQATNPLAGIISAGIAQHLRACHHSLTKLFGKSCERLLVHSKRAKSCPCKGNRNPSLFAFDGLPCLLNRGNLVENSRQPPPPLCWLVKRQKFVPSRDRRDTCQDEMLDIVELKHPATRITASDQAWSTVNFSL